MGQRAQHASTKTQKHKQIMKTFSLSQHIWQNTHETMKSTNALRHIVYLLKRIKHGHVSDASNLSVNYYRTERQFEKHQVRDKHFSVGDCE